jgi:tRNA 2-thiouridine synthesizing protein A
MDKKTVNCCGYSCPEPVIMARKAMMAAGQGELFVKVSTAVARDNVTRAAKSLGWTTEVQDAGDYYLLSLKR